MTKIYTGNDTYDVTLSSGKTLVLTETEMNEIAEDAGIISDTKAELEDKFSDRLSAVTDEIGSKLDELDDALSYGSEYKEIVPILVSLREAISGV